MKILRLDLLAFGPFSDLSLTLDEGQHGFHLVYGPNEAGKSSSLRGLQQWLYGIPHATADNFIHPNQNLRIGGLLESADGKRLEFIRRKGRTKTMRGPDDSEAIDPSRLTDMLAGVNEATFCQRFGIDYEELRKGGEAVVRGGGDLGDMLFTAGAGITDVHLVQSQIQSEMQELFKAGGSIPRINDAIKRLKTARDEIKEAQVPTSLWVKHDDARSTAEKRQIEISEQLGQKLAQHSRLERIEKALPIISHRRRLEQQLSEVGDVPLLPEEFSGDRRETITALANAQQAETDATNMIKRLNGNITELHFPPSMLEHRTAITKLHTELGGYQKAAKDRPGLVLLLENTEQQARAILKDLGHDPEIQHAEQLRLSRVQRQRIQSLAGDCNARLDKQSSAEKAVRKLREEIQRLETRLATLPARTDAGGLKQAIRRAQKHGDLDKQLSDANIALRDLEKQADVDLKMLRLWDGTLEELEQLPVPTSETIDRFENEFADANSAIKTIEERIVSLGKRARDIDQNLAKLELEQDVPTEENLKQARQRRDAGWQLVRQTWSDGLPADDPATMEFISEHAPGADLEQAFQSSVETADDIADRLRREADRVASKAQLTADRQNLDLQLDEQTKYLAAARETLKNLRLHWNREWTVVNIDPRSPREMRSWLSQQKALANSAEAIRKQSAAVKAVRTLVESLRTDMDHCLKPLGKSIPSECNSLARATENCETVVEAAETANRQLGECERDLRKLSDELSEAEPNAELAKKDLEQWRSDWAEAVAFIGLDHDSAPSEANSVIESVDELFSLLRKASDIRGRIAGIDQDAEEFKKSIEQLLTPIADDLLKLPLVQAVADLYDRLDAANTAQTKRDGWNEQLEAEKTKHDEARSNVKLLKAKLEAMCRQADCESVDDLPAVEERAALRRDAEKDLKSNNELLDGLAAGTPLEEFVVEAEQITPDQLQADLQRLSDEIANLNREKTEVDQAIGSHRTELKRMDGSGRAAEAQEQAEYLLSQIRSDAEQYIRLRLASAVLRRSIERFREASQGPVLSRASELFASLTLGSFDGLRADYDDKGKAVLVGKRAGNGQTVDVNGMSDGTRDQLYLALRLALLESCQNEREPLPFIVDDILIKFDDDRAVAALKVLASISEKTQVIFFTHHEHLKQLACDNLDDDVLFTHTLDHRATARAKASGAGT